MALTVAQKHQLLQDEKTYKKESMREAQLTRSNITSDKKHLHTVLHKSKQAIAEDVQQKLERSMKTNREKQLVEGELLAFEMIKLKDQEMAELRVQQQLRARPVLAALQSKLRWGYSNKSIDAQLHEKSLRKQCEKFKNRETYKRLQDANVTFEQQRYAEALAKMEKKLQYKAELQEQIVRREQFRRHEYELRLQEKNVMDDIIQRLDDEDKMAARAKKCKLLRLQQEIDEFKRVQTQWRQKQRDTLAGERRKELEAACNKNAEDKMQLERIRINEVKSVIAENIAKRIYNEQAIKKEKEDTIQDLLDEERKEAMNRRHADETERLRRSKEEIRSSLAFQILERKLKREDESKEDALYKELIIEKSNEEVRKQKEQERRKRETLVALREEGEEMMREKRRAFAINKQVEMNLQEEAQEEQNAYDSRIERERDKLIEAHFGHLRGFLPPNTLTAKERIKYGR